MIGSIKQTNLCQVHFLGDLARFVSILLFGYPRVEGENGQYFSNAYTLCLCTTYPVLLSALFHTLVSNLLWMISPLILLQKLISYKASRNLHIFGMFGLLESWTKLGILSLNYSFMELDIAS